MLNNFLIISNKGVTLVLPLAIGCGVTLQLDSMVWEPYMTMARIKLRHI